MVTPLSSAVEMYRKQIQKAMQCHGEERYLQFMIAQGMWSMAFKLLSVSDSTAFLKAANVIDKTNNIFKSVQHEA